MKLGNYSNRDGQIKLDLVGEKNNLSHIFEIKWRNKPTDYRETENFLEKVERSEFSGKRKKLFLISKSGFTQGALKFAESNDIDVLNKNLEGGEIT
ncbi:MAG: hypothetical protein U9Q22_00430 [Candidatus Altiarchaeota archaeon]|nr:hypothetical protein [Candidatus Altiarchaeota archaeon]